MPDKLDTTCYRGSMAYDIRDRVLRTGVARSRGAATLGKPDFNSPTELRATYWACGGRSWDYDDLHVFLNQQRVG